MIISRTPMRISLAGGGSDLSAYYTAKPGMVVSTAIDKYIYISVNRNNIFEDVIRICYSKTEIVRRVEDIEHNIIREALKLTGIQGGIEVVYMGDIPVGSAGVGLGSSSSLAVGLLNALHAFAGRHVSADRLAEEACRIEIQTLGHPIGKQDQYIAAFGGIQCIQFNPDESVFVDPIICSHALKQALERRLMLFYTGIDRISSDVLAEQKANTRRHMDDLDAMVALAKDMRQALIEGRLDAVGELLHDNWTRKKRLSSGITNPEIDLRYERARAAGAIGGKIAGAGGGGFMLLYCPEERQEAVRAALSDLKETRFSFEPQGSKIIYVSR